MGVYGFIAGLGVVVVRERAARRVVGLAAAQATTTTVEGTEEATMDVFFDLVSEDEVEAAYEIEVAGNDSVLC